MDSSSRVFTPGHSPGLSDGKLADKYLIPKLQCHVRVGTLRILLRIPALPSQVRLGSKQNMTITAPKVVRVGGRELRSVFLKKQSTQAIKF